MKQVSTVYVVDDDPMIHTWLKAVFEPEDIPVVAYLSGQQFLQEYRSECSGCLLLDLQMPEMNGLELQHALQEKGNQTPIIFLTGTADVSNAVEALKNGAFDFLEKPLDRNTLISCVRKAFEQDLRDRYEQLQQLQTAQKIEKLTNREQEVLRWLVDGKSNKVIADILKISTRTVEIHRKNIMQKMEVDSLAGLVQQTLQAEKY